MTITDESDERLTGRIPDSAGGLRVDQALVALFPEYSRSRLTQWIRDGRVLLEGVACEPKRRVHGGEMVALLPVAEPATDAVAQDLPLTVVFADEHLIVIDKPAGLVVHPAAGNPDGTLQNALLHHFPELATLPRSGIVHRLDKDTSGLLVVARSSLAHKSLVDQLQTRTMGREYDTVVVGEPDGEGTVEGNIGRHPTDRKRMAVVKSGKPAVTHFRVIDWFDGFARLAVKLESGRTHQIRVHMAHIQHPVVGDLVYGRRHPGNQKTAGPLNQYLAEFRRQALHAARLTLRHPAHGETMSWEAPLPEDHAKLLELMEQAADFGDTE